MGCVGYVDELDVGRGEAAEDGGESSEDGNPPVRPTNDDVPDDGAADDSTDGGLDDEEDEPESEGNLAGSIPSGGGCNCDSDCESTGGQSPLCIHGICGVRATDDQCVAGSTSACPPDHRCWSGTGMGVCYPDFIEGQCEGREDADGSCVGAGQRGCYAVCGELCDLSGDPPGGGEAVEPEEDPDEDPEPVEPDVCEYPDGPYQLGRGQVIPPIRWTSAVAGAAETSESADLEALMCEDGVRGVFIYAGATWCSSCSQMLRDIAAQRDVWESNGIRWIFIESDLSSASQASDYIARSGIDFGFATNDSDNSEGRNAIIESGLFSTIPWIAVIRTSDMVMTHDMAASVFDPATVAEELGL